MWISDHKFGAGNRGVLNRKDLRRVLEAFLSHDQLNFGGLAGLEIAAKSLQLCEEQEREQIDAGKGKEADGLLDSHLYLWSGADRGKLSICPVLNEWIASQLRKGAAVLKERRKAREERALRRPKA